MRNKDIFGACESHVDPSPFIEACKSDICSDESSFHRDAYRCRAIAAYAYACSKKQILLNWFEHEDLKDLKQACYNSNYGKCFGGSFYTDRARTKNTTCRDLFVKSHEKYSNNYDSEDEPVAGCSCPENQYLELIDNRLQCVPISSCNCVQVETNRVFAAGEKIKKACSTW